MTNLEAINKNEHKHFNEIITLSSEDTLSEMLSGVECGRCICKEYCRNSNALACQMVIRDWLYEEYEG